MKIRVVALLFVLASIALTSAQPLEKASTLREDVNVVRVLAEGTTIDQDYVDHLRNDYGLQSLSATYLDITANHTLISGLNFTDDILGIRISDAYNVTVAASLIGNQSTSNLGISIVNSVNVTISNVNFDSYNVTGNFTGITVSGSTNVTISQVKMERISVTQNFLALKMDNSENVTVTNMQVIGGVNSPIDGDFSGIEIETSQSVGMSAISFQNVNATALSFLSMTSVTDSVVSGLTVTSSWHSGSGMKVIDLQSAQNLNITAVSANTLGTAVRFIDPVGAADMFGIIVNQSSNLRLSVINITSIVAEPYGFTGIELLGSTNVVLDLLNFDNILAGRVNGIKVETTNTFLLNNSIFRDIEGTGVQMIHVSSSSGTMGINNTVVENIEATSKGEMVIIEGTDGLTLQNIVQQGITTSSTLHPLVGIRIDRSDNTKIEQSLLQSFLSSLTPIYGIWVNSSVNVLVNDTDISSLKSKGSFSVGYLSTGGQSGTTTRTAFSYISGKSSTTISSTEHKLQAVSSYDPIGYAVILETSTNMVLLANNVLATDTWIAKDESTTVTLVNNTVNGLSSALVSLVGPNDVSVDVSEDPVILQWVATTNPSNQSYLYAVFVDGELTLSGNWTSGSPVSFNTANLTIGDHTIEIVFTELNGLNTSDIVQVTITELIPPVFTAVQSSVTVASGVSYMLMWNATDSNPDTFSLIRNDTEVLFGSWTSGNAIFFDVKSTPVGIWNFTMIFRDNLNNEISSSAIVNIVEPVAMFLVYGDIDLTYNKGDLAFMSFEFQGLEGGNYTISIDGIPSIFGQWRNFQPNVVNITDFELGQHKVAVIGIDKLFQTAAFEVTILVLPAIPEESNGIDLNQRLENILEQPAVSNNLPIFLTIIGIFLVSGVVIQYRLRKGKMPRLQNFLSRKSVPKKADVTPKKKSSKKTSKKKTTKKK